VSILIAVAVVAVIGYLVFRKKRKPADVRYARSKMIKGKNVSAHGRPAKQMRPARWCGHPGCDQISAICRRQTAEAEYPEGMLGKRKGR
jgi:hypothetical protein